MARTQPSLNEIYPDRVAQLWDSSISQPADPRTISLQSSKKVGWKCSSCGHQWRASPNSITRAWVIGRRGCKACAGQIASGLNNLAAKYPEIAAEWNSEKNGDLKPSDLTSSSGRKVWWLCKKNPAHEWQATPNKRSSGRGCPFCSSRKLHRTNSLATGRPDLAAGWHPTRNGELTPADVMSSSHSKVWWLCTDNSAHEWPAAPNVRSRSPNCPFCCGRLLHTTTTLQAVLPELAAEWHPTLNEELRPADIHWGSRRRVWWSCVRGHAWQAQVGHRSRGSGCPKCTNQTSRPELRILAELTPIFPDITHRVRIERDECDLHLPSLQVAIMVDGLYYHRDRGDKDTEATARLEKAGIRVIRLRGNGLPSLGIGHNLSFTEAPAIRLSEVQALVRAYPGSRQGNRLSLLLRAICHARDITCYRESNARQAVVRRSEWRAHSR